MTPESPLARLRSLPTGPERKPFLRYLEEFSEPADVASEVVDLLETDDPYVAPPDQFYESPNSNLYEEWEHPVNARTLHENSKGRLLCLPPGSNRFSTYREIIPTILEDHMQTRYPRLKSELANRPNLFFQGIFYPDQISVESMEMISLHHGRNYVVQCDLALEGSRTSRTVVLKPASMGVESGVTSLLDELNRRMSPDLRGRVGPIRTPSIVSVEDAYGILEYLPGKNGVEILPRGMNTGSIHALKSNEYPEEFDLSSDGLMNVADEFAKQSALAFYLRIYDRKPDQMMFHSTGPGRYRIYHIDFGRSLKKNYALPWKRYYATERAPLVFDDHQVPYLEAATSLIFLPHFIPENLRDEHNPYSGSLRRRLRRTFVELGYFFNQNAEVIREHYQALIGQKTQFDEKEVETRKVTAEDVREVSETLRSFDPKPEEIFSSVLNLARAERSGGAPSESPDDSADTIYDRALRSGKASRRLVNRTEGPNGYHLKNYRQGGKVYYDHEDQVLRVDFGPSPQTIIDYVYWHFAPSLAEFFEEFTNIKPGTQALVQLNGQSRITIPPGFVRRDVEFPQQSLNQVRRVARGFAPPDHLEEHIQQFRHWEQNHPEADYLQTEIERQKKILEANMDGKEILQWYERTTPDSSPVGSAIEEIIHHLLSNPDYLADKDPLKSINDLVVNLGHKHEFISPLTEDDVTVPENLRAFFESCREVYNKHLPVGNFPRRTPQHLSHVKIMGELADLVLEEHSLSPPEEHLIRTAILAHNLGLRNRDFSSLLMNPNDRLTRPIYEKTLLRHPEFAEESFQSLRTGEGLTLPEELDESRLIELLVDHHRVARGEKNASKGNSLLHEILHVVDNLAVFADRTRPDYWLRGYFRLTDLAPRWIDAQFQNGNIRQSLYENLTELVETRPDDLNGIGNEARRFVELHNALRLAALLEDGLHPQNPHTVRQLRERHDRTRIDTLWFRVLESDLPVSEKVKMLRRINDLLPLFTNRDPAEYVFLNGSPRPVQRTVDRIEDLLAADKSVILTGVFPRVTEAFARFLENTSIEDERIRNRVYAIAGEHRLQFIRHSYPYEAEFERPLHQIIEEYRQTIRPETELCLIPFLNFYRGYSPVENPASRVRKLEKASAVEEHETPDQVLDEARRFHRANRETYHLDRRENNRFRRILLNDFSNREILYFYRETLMNRPGAVQALQELIGALWENPNYLSDRNSRYALHELVRSLSQIHFFEGDESRIRDRVYRRLEHHGVNQKEAFKQLLDPLGGELNFFKESLEEAIRHFEVLSDHDTAKPDELFLILSAGWIAKDDAWRDYLLSPEDISYNGILRRQLRSNMPDLSRETLRNQGLEQLPEDARDAVLKSWKNPDSRTLALVQTALYLSLCVDFSRIENWERGHRRVITRDLSHFLPPLERLLEQAFSSDLSGWVISRVKDRLNKGLLSSLNDHAERTHSYILLFNAVTHASELRYGLFPGAVNSLDNVRELYGAVRVNHLLDGIVQSDLSALESLKIARKIRPMASALQKSDLQPEGLRILNVNRSGTWTRTGTNGRPLILTGELANALSFWKTIREEQPDLRERCYFLVGEEYPLLLKETTLSRTSDLRKAVENWRNEHDRSGQYLFLPAREILGELSAANLERPPDFSGSRSTLYFQAWLDLYESNARTAFIDLE